MRSLSKALVAFGLIVTVVSVWLLLTQERSSHVYQKENRLSMMATRESDAETRIRNDVEPSSDMLRLAPTAYLTGRWSSDTNIWNCNSGSDCVQVDFVSEKSGIKASWLVTYDRTPDKHVGVRLLNEAAANMFVYKPLLNALKTTATLKSDDDPDPPAHYLMNRCPTGAAAGCHDAMQSAYSFLRIGSEPHAYDSSIQENVEGWWTAQRVSQAPAKRAADCAPEVDCWIVTFTPKTYSGERSWRRSWKNSEAEWVPVDLSRIMSATEFKGDSEAQSLE